MLIIKIDDKLIISTSKIKLTYFIKKQLVGNLFFIQVSRQSSVKTLIICTVVEHLSLSFVLLFYERNKIIDIK